MAWASWDSVRGMDKEAMVGMERYVEWKGRFVDAEGTEWLVFIIYVCDKELCLSVI